MFKNHLKVALRNLIKHKFYSIINILGLSLGLTSFLMITLFVLDEMSYDEFHMDGERIFRIDFTANINGTDLITSRIAAPVAETMKKDFPEVENATRIFATGNWMFKRKDSEITHKLEKAAFVDPNLFLFFDLPLISGDAKTCLKRPNTLVLRKDVADRIFGDVDPIGQIVNLDSRETGEVTGIYEIPQNSHFNFPMMLSMETFEEAKSQKWFMFYFSTYVKLTENAPPTILAKKLPGLIEKYLAKELKDRTGNNSEGIAQSENVAAFSLFPLKDIHLRSHKSGELGINGDIKYVYSFSTIALFILILACINFMNLATARSVSRAKEVGVRKVMGAQRIQLTGQLLAETFLLVSISVVISYCFSFLMLPFFNELSGKEVSLAQLFSTKLLLAMFLVLIVVGLLAGSYPAFYLSRFKPIETLKGKLKLGSKVGGIRSFLVVLQFSVSMIMLICTAVIFQQLNYLQKKNLGYSKDNILMLKDTWILKDKIEPYKQEVLQYSNIKNGTKSRYLPANTTGGGNRWFTNKNPGKEDIYFFHQYRVDHDYVKTLGIDIISGRDFSKEHSSDSSVILLNETAVQKLGWKDDPIGKKLFEKRKKKDSVYYNAYTIIGIVKDFHFASLKQPIEPLVIGLKSSHWYYLSFKISPIDIPNTIKYLKTKWGEFAPGQPFEYRFLDDRFNELYRTEQKTAELFRIFAILALLIACLGLYGLSTFTVGLRTKEIGTRKVLGASIPSIILLLSKDFLKLIGIAFLISAPVSYYFMNNWLQDFDNRISINYLTFLLAGILTLLVAWVTMSFKSWNAASVNPVESLKDE